MKLLTTITYNKNNVRRVEKSIKEISQEVRELYGLNTKTKVENYKNFIQYNFYGECDNITYPYIFKRLEEENVTK